MQEKSWRQSSAVFHKRAAEYDSWFEESLLFAIETEAIKSLQIPQATPALEIGVGPGRFATEFGSDFGIDPANAPLHIAAKRNIKVCQAVGEALPFLDKSFAKVSLFFTLCFVQNPEKVLTEAHRVLRDDGDMLLGFVPSTGQWGKALLKKKEAKHPFYEHARFYSIDDCETLLRNSGLFIHDARSTLYQAPESVDTMETARSELDNQAGFIALHAKKHIS